MSLDTLNLHLFGVINAAQDASQWMIHLAIFIANDLLYILIFFLLFLWCYGDPELKERAMKAVFLTVVALGVGYLISLFYHHPRPFVIDVGRTIIQHAPTASFPSNHMLIFSTIALSYLFAARKIAGAILLILAVMVAWSRIYLGVHFPLDMLGAFLVALLVNVFGQYFWQHYGQQLMKLAMTIYQTLCKPLLDKGIIK